MGGDPQPGAGSLAAVSVFQMCIAALGQMPFPYRWELGCAITLLTNAPNFLHVGLG